MGAGVRPVAGAGAGALPADAPPSRYTWDERIGRYRGPGGRLVRETAVRDALDGVLARADNRARTLGEALRARRLSVRDWELAMRREIKRAQLSGYIAAKGGRAQLSAADFGRIGATCREQYAYLRRFRRQIEQGQRDGSYPLDGRFLRRVELYTEAGRGTFHAVERREKDRLGFAEERNVRHAADSCAGCIAATARGWVPIGDLPPIGARDCRQRCRCTLEFRKPAQADGGGD